MTFETFNDPCYFDMWCVRSTGDKDFNMTIHLTKREDAEHAKCVIEEWMKQAKREALIEAAEFAERIADRGVMKYELRKMAEEL